MKRVLVIGAGGFVARHLIPALRASGRWHVIAAGRGASAAPWLGAVEYLACDVDKPGEAERVIGAARPEALVNLAARVSGTAAELCRTNTVAVAAWLRALRMLAPECRIIQIGSAAEYGIVTADRLPIIESTECRPIGAYGVSKLAASEVALDAARAWQARVTVVRPFNIVGAHMPAFLVGGALIERVRAALRTGAPSVRVGRVDTQRDFVAIEDVVDALLTLLDMVESGTVYNLCSGQPVAIHDLLAQVLAQASPSLGWVIDPALVRPDDAPVSYGSYAAAAGRFGFQPRVSLASAIAAAWRAGPST